jgi:hypothetical protein
MRDVWRWWKVRRSQLQALLVLGLVLFGMCLNLWQTQRHFNIAIRSHDEIMGRMEAIRKHQINKLLEVVEAHHAQQDLDAAALRNDLWALKFMIGELIEHAGKQAVR